MLWFKKKVKIDTIEFLRINRDIFDRYENHLYQNLLDLLAKNEIELMRDLTAGNGLSDVYLRSIREIAERIDDRMVVRRIDRLFMISRTANK